jgi:tricorn protease-like protein
MIKVVRDDKVIVAYTKMHNKLIIITLPDEQAGTTAKIIYIKCNSISENEIFGKVINFQADNTDKYLIVTFDTSQILVVELDTGVTLKRLEKPEMAKP